MSFSITRIAIHGASGRMGQRLIQLAAADPQLAVTAALERSDHPRLGEDAGTLAGIDPLRVRLRSGLPQVPGQNPVDVVIDFSTPAATLALLDSCVAARLPLVVGTTGLEARDKDRLADAAASIPLLVAANFSRAVNVLFHLARETARLLGNQADIEIVERHHHFKKDAPSGTALRLAESIQAALGPRPLVHGRAGMTGERPQGEIGMHALRTGDNPGEHTVVFGLMGECIELTHRALSRDGFARGALEAARFVAGKPPGLYTMADLLDAGPTV
jgi:4-hydroxy-tetrahydrodipicolinate reductase